VTGWRIGYAIAHESLINSLVAAQRVTVFCNNKPCSVFFLIVIILLKTPL